MARKVAGQTPIYVISMMQPEKVIVLCGSRLGISVIRDLYFTKQLRAIAVPAHCQHFLQQLNHLMPDVPALPVNRQNYMEVLDALCKKHAVTTGIMIGFSYKLPAKIFNQPINGFFNMHPGPLPAYRGPDPIFQQVKNREKYAAVTLHKVDEGYDTGPIVLTDKIRLMPSDTHGRLITRLGELAGRMLGILFKILAMGMPVPSRPQDHSQAKFYTKQQANDVTVNWQTMDADAIIALINACNPWNKGAAASLNGTMVKLLQAEKAANENPGQSGTIISALPDSLLVSVKNNEAISIKALYTDEGFLAGTALYNSGIKGGMIFN
jgi:methionyl-tRNA formyltransferase